MAKSPQRQSREYSIKSHCEAHIAMLKEEVNIALDHVVFVTGHGNGYFKEIEDKLAEIAEYQSILDVLEKEF